MEWVCRHMGHNQRVHIEHYRQMSSLLERVYLTKMFIIQDLNLTQKFKNQNLNDIDIKGEFCFFNSVTDWLRVEVTNTFYSVQINF